MSEIKTKIKKSSKSISYGRKEIIFISLFILSVIYLTISINLSFQETRQNTREITRFLDEEKSIQVTNFEIVTPIKVGQPLVIRGKATITRKCMFYVDRFVFDRDGEEVWKNTEIVHGEIMNNEPFVRRFDLGTLPPDKYKYQARARAVCEEPGRNRRTIPITTDVYNFQIVE